MKSTRSPTVFDQNNYDVTSIPGYVIKRNSSRGVKPGPSEREKMYTRRHKCLKMPGKESTDAIRQYFHDGTATKTTESYFQPQGGKNTT